MRETEPCSWCGTGVEESDGFRAYEPAGDRRAVFCRLEHIVPWAIQGARWEPGSVREPEQPSPSCAHCGSELGEARLILVRHRGEHRIPDHFCSLEHMADWAKAGGRWQ